MDCIEVIITCKIGRLRYDISKSTFLDDEELRRLIWEEWESEIKEEDPREMVFKYMKLMRKELIYR